MDSSQRRTSIQTHAISRLYRYRRTYGVGFSRLSTSTVVYSTPYNNIKRQARQTIHLRRAKYTAAAECQD